MFLRFEGQTSNGQSLKIKSLFFRSHLNFVIKGQVRSWLSYNLVYITVEGDFANQVLTRRRRRWQAQQGTRGVRQLPGHIIDLGGGKPACHGRL